MKIALDAQGADHGIGEVVAGARIVAAEGIEIDLYGPETQIRAALGADVPDNIGVVEAPDEITNHDDPVTAARAKRESSIVVAAKAVADGGADALVSAGPTGAVLAASLFNMKRIKGVRRPAIAVILPDGRGGRSLLLDAGASVEVPPEMLVQFAHLGAQFSARVLGNPRPRVGLLTIGEEDGKGTERVVEAGRLLSDPANTHGFNYLGNVEGRDITNGAADVIVTDGFTGNVALKAIEGAATATMQALVDVIKSSPRAKLGGMLAKPKLLELRDRVDPNTTGGALLLGLRGVSVVAHGSSTAAGIAAAVRLASASAIGDVTGHMAAAIAELKVHTESNGGVTVGVVDDA
ncbi:MAG: phosphate acyltransferase PlsX [Thermoleophilia bacterium]|nr:phosphate acyltransferase PlsX [Thermoleophilia bacterium]